VAPNQRKFLREGLWVDSRRQSATQNNSILESLEDVLARIADLPASRLHELLPWEWKRLRQADMPAYQQAA
jgi:hypothetical protein